MVFEDKLRFSFLATGILMSSRHFFLNELDHSYMVNELDHNLFLLLRKQVELGWKYLKFIYFFYNSQGWFFLTWIMLDIISFEGIGEACLSSNSDKKTFLTKVLCVLVERSWRTILNTSMIDLSTSFSYLMIYVWDLFFSLFLGSLLDGVGNNCTFWKEDAFLIIFHPIWCLIGFLSQINQ